MGGFGLLTLGILDSSFLFMPLGNDLLIVAMTARRHSGMLYYAAMASAGSVLGCVLLDLVFRKGGEEGLARHLSPKRLQYIKQKVNKNAGWALAMACLMPPPFPFTPFVMGASALQYPRKKLFSIIGALRMVRFTAEGLLAVKFGPRILKLAQSTAVQDAVIGFIVLCIGGSAWSVYSWVKRSRKHAA
jgi:membrane protein DedA with SNARE-associated domain